MRFTVGNLEVDLSEVGVRGLGFGQGTHGRPVFNYTCIIAPSLFWRLVQDLLVEFVAESIQEYELGIELEDRWMTEYWELGDLASQLRDHPSVVERIALEFESQRLLMALLDTQGEDRDLKYVVNLLCQIEIGEEVVLRGEAFLAVGKD